MLDSMLVNIISSFLYDELKEWIADKELKSDINKMKEWMNEFTNLHEESIIATNKFYFYFEHYNIMDKILSYVIDPKDSNQTEEEFAINILTQFENSGKEYCKLKPLDYSLAKEFIHTLINKITDIFISKMTTAQKTMLHLIFKKINSGLSIRVNGFIESEPEKKDICIIQKDVYELNIAEFLAKSFCLYTNDFKEKNEFDNCIISINKSWKISWKNKIINYLIGYIESDIEILKCYRSMDNKTYDQIYQIINKQYRNFKLDDQHKAAIAELISSPYNKVLLVTGDHGSGKTHFLREFIEFNILLSDENYIVPINTSELIRELKIKALDTILIQYVNGFLTIKIESLNDIITYFNNPDEAIITFVIDDIDKLYHQHIEEFYILLEKIEEYTKFDFIRWIISVSNYDAYMIESKYAGFISKYCMECESIYGRKVQQLIPGINMSIYGQVKEIGKKIFDLYGKKLIVNDVFKKNKNYLDSINIALYAHVLAMNTDQNEVIAYSNAYYKFINEVYTTVNSRIQNLSSHSHEVECAIKRLAMLVVSEHKKILFQSSITSILDMNIFYILNECKLINYVGKNVSDNIYDINYKKNVFEIMPDVYWAVKIIINESIEYNDDVRMIYSDLLRIENMQSTIMPCFIQYLNNSKLSDVFDVVSGYMMNDRHYQFALFCAHQLSTPFRVMVNDKLTQSKRKKLTEIETFAMLQYLYEYNPTLEESSNVLTYQFTLLHKYESSISNNNLEEILRNVIIKILNDIDIVIFTEAIVELFEGKETSVNNVLGQECGKKFYYLIREIEDDDENIIKFLYNYFLNKQNNFDPYCNKIPFSFYEMLARSFLEKYFLRGKISDLYSKFNEVCLETENESLRIFFSRCFSCTIGNIYRMRWIDYDSFQMILVKQIGESPDLFRYKIAIHIIMNSIVNSHHSTDKIDKRLKPYINTLLLYNKFVLWLNKESHYNIKSFIEYNIGRKI